MLNKIKALPEKVPLALKVPTKEKAPIERKVPYTPDAGVERERPALAKFLMRWRFHCAGVRKTLA
jgi:hypothetical protein